MRVLWALSAEQDRADIVDFIALDNPRAAIRRMRFSKQPSTDWPSTH
jgi:plasmid stabilization system protein ParE